MAETSAFTSAGTKLYVSSSAPASFDETGYGAVSWTEINEITDMGEIGRVYADVTHKPINNRQTFHKKGGFDDGGLQLQMAHAPADPGQVILAAALNDDNDYYFKLEYNDNPGGSSNTIEYFPAQVFSAPKAVGNVDSMTTKTVNVMVDGDIVLVDAVT